MNPSKAVLLKYKEQSMIQGQLEPSCQQHALTSGKGHLLGQHPVLIPVILLSGSVGLCTASFFADTLFPVLAWLDVPAALLCLSAALVSGITGLLASIISILESLDRYRLRNRLHIATFPNLEMRPCNDARASSFAQQGRKVVSKGA